MIDDFLGTMVYQGVIWCGSLAAVYPPHLAPPPNPTLPKNCAKTSTPHHFLAFYSQIYELIFKN